MSSSSSVAGVAVLGELHAGFSSILSSDALAFLAALHRKFEAESASSTTLPHFASLSLHSLTHTDTVTDRLSLCVVVGLLADGALCWPTARSGRPNWTEE